MDILIEYGLSGAVRATADGFVEFGRFFLLYARALQGLITVQEIGEYSRQWSGEDVQHNRRLLLCAIESEVFAEQCLRRDLVYEAAHLHLARLRLLCELTYSEATEEVQELWNEAIQRLYQLCTSYVDRVHSAWSIERDMVKTWFKDVYMTTYPVQCARIMELTSLAYFAAATNDDQQRHAAFVHELLQKEPGCAHTISD